MIALVPGVQLGPLGTPIPLIGARLTVGSVLTDPLDSTKPSRTHGAPAYLRGTR